MLRILWIRIRIRNTAENLDHSLAQILCFIVSFIGSTSAVDSCVQDHHSLDQR